MKKIIASLLVGTSLLYGGSVVITWDYEPEYLASGPFEDLAQVSFDLISWTNLTPPYPTVTNYPGLNSKTGKSYFLKVKDWGITNRNASFRVYRWWTDTNAHPLEKNPGMR